MPRVRGDNVSLGTSVRGFDTVVTRWPRWGVSLLPRRDPRCSEATWELDVSEPNDATFDIVILGGGSGGYATALRAVQLGLTVALVEKSKLGGTCLHNGCIPTKALLHAAEVADQTRDAAQFGVKAELVGIDIAAVNSYKDGVVSRLYKGLQGMLKSNKAITIVEGARPAGRAEHGRGGRQAVHRPQRRAGLRLVRQEPARPGDRRRAGHHQRPRPGPGPGPQLGDRARRRRDRRRVRQRVEVLRRGRDDHRGAAPAGRRRGRGVVEGAGARVPQAEDQLQGRQAVRAGREDRQRGQGDHRRRRDRRGRAAAGRGRPRARTPPISGTRSRASRWTAATC